jgi:hypothetical protein
MAELAVKIDQAVKVMAKMEGGVKILLEIDRVLTNDELSLLEKAT